MNHFYAYPVLESPAYSMAFQRFVIIAPRESTLDFKADFRQRCRLCHMGISTHCGDLKTPIFYIGAGSMQTDTGR